MTGTPEEFVEFENTLKKWITDLQAIIEVLVRLK